MPCHSMLLYSILFHYALFNRLGRDVPPPTLPQHGWPPPFLMIWVEAATSRWRDGVANRTVEGGCGKPAVAERVGGRQPWRRAW